MTNLMIVRWCRASWRFFAAKSVVSTLKISRLCGWFGLLLVLTGGCVRADGSLSPTALVASPDGAKVYVACLAAAQVKVVDVASRRIMATISVQPQPTGLALSADGERLFVTCAAPKSSICVVTLPHGKITATLAAGHTAMAPVLSPDGKTLFVCNRFNNHVSVLEIASGRELGRIPVTREPVAAAITPDGRHLLVANHLPSGRADQPPVASVISVIDTSTLKVVKELQLLDGCGSLNDLRISPDGKTAVVTHILSRYQMPASQLERGWMNTNAKTIVDLTRMEILSTVLLDSAGSGAANPWGAAWSAAGETLVIAHAGTHEVSLINFPGLLAKLTQLPRASASGSAKEYSADARTQDEVAYDLGFVNNTRRRVSLPEGDLGPRAVVMAGQVACVANYFSDTLSMLDTAVETAEWKTIPLGPRPPMTIKRQGELYFNDARICFQGWQSCASCHPSEARMDVFNWDLLNDGIGNQKNSRSLLLALKTPPSMSLGVRATGEMAVRAGIRHILFTMQPPEVGEALDAYLKSLQPVPSPLLKEGVLSPAAQRGKILFHDSSVGCADCHPNGLFTDLQSYDVGTNGRFDKPKARFDTPTLVEVWRTAPYLHDGSAATIRDVLTTRNLRDEHGSTSKFSKQQLDDLIEYVLSL